MIQRIQTLYLLAAAIFMGLFSYLPILYFSTAKGELFDIYARGIAIGGEMIDGVIYMLILAIACAVLPFVTIFLFKRRMLQIRMCVVNIVLLVGNYVMTATYFFMAMAAFKEVGVVSKGFHPVLFAPAAAIVFAVLAAKAIFRDELLVRSVDRIR